ncbi:MAG: O-antigen ligase family protein [Acidobacteriota bacterium]
MRWGELGLWLLVAGAALNGMHVEVGGKSVYPEYITLVTVAVPLAVVTWRRRLRLALPAAAWPLMGWLSVALVASLVNAPDVGHSVILWSKLVMMVATFVVVANLARPRLEVAVGAQLTVAACVATIAIGAVVAWHLAGSQVGMQRATGGGWVPKATLIESNVLGSYSAAAVLLGLTLAGRRARSRRRVRVAAWAAALLGGGALVISVTRTAWVGFLVALGCAGSVSLASRGGRWVRVGLACAGTLLLALLALTAVDLGPPSPNWTPYTPESAGLVYRLRSLTHIRHDGNLWVRYEICRNAVQHWRRHPWIGWGVGAYEDMFLYPNQNAPGWIPNLFVHHLFDSGVIGLAALVAGIGMTLRGGVRAWARSGGGDRRVLAGLLLALVSLAVAFQATEASWLAYPWVYLGVLEAAAARSREWPPAKPGSGTG